MKFIYRAYQLFIALPIFIVITIITSLLTVVGCAISHPNITR